MSVITYVVFTATTCPTRLHIYFIKCWNLQRFLCFLLQKARTHWTVLYRKSSTGTFDENMTWQLTKPKQINSDRCLLIYWCQHRGRGVFPQLLCVRFSTQDEAEWNVRDIETEERVETAEVLAQRPSVRTAMLGPKEIHPVYSSPVKFTL